jgi:hypothetical protein
MMANKESLKLWYDLRKRAIHERVSAHDVLQRHGVSFRHTTEREEQFSCPFHGKDEKPSARVYPTTPQSPSHVWCFVCQGRWDVIALWKKYSGEEKSFHRILTEIEMAYGLTPPPVPEGAFEAPVDDRAKVKYETFYGLCEHRLKDAREVYRANADMNGYLVLGSMLDKIYSRVGSGRLTYVKAVEILQQLVEKIGKCVRAQASEVKYP